ncbi:MAG: GNAT family N-acetyltransferase [Rhizobiales bacterium]|nr:GNAT family N-acetyltransferase [Hyphomicrobiales bacterium]
MQSPTNSDITLRLARSFDDMARVLAVRSAVYIGEETCPFEEEFDGNDFCAAHLLAFCDGEPAGVLRIRFFAGWAKFERLAVRREFRARGLGRHLAEEAQRYCARKGYRRVLAHSRHDRISFWAAFGFAAEPGAPSFIFSDYSYQEVWCDLDPDPSGLPIGADPYVTIRPENDWERPGRLERSLTRATRSQPLFAGDHRATA